MTKNNKIWFLGILCPVLALACTVQAVAWVVTNRRALVDDMGVHLLLPRGVFATATPAPATLSSDALKDYDFAAAVGIDADRILNPVSTPDTVNWYLPNDVLSDGSVSKRIDNEWFTQLESYLVDDYIINQTFYLVNTYTEDVVLQLCDVVIGAGSGVSTASNLFHAVRVAVTYDGVVTTYRSTSADDDWGTARPASGTGAETDDFSVPAGVQSPAAVNIVLPAAQPAQEGVTGNMNLTTAAVNIKIWIEGQNADAVSGYAGTSFRVSLKFSDAVA